MNLLFLRFNKNRATFLRTSKKDPLILLLHINMICSRMIMTPARSVVHLHGQTEFCGSAGNKYLISVGFFYYGYYGINIIVSI